MNINIDNLEVGDLIPVPPEPKMEWEVTSNWGSNYSDPLVTILCHTYNHVNFLKDALNSFLMQETTFPFEILLHDDASTDGTIEIVNEYAKNYPNIIIPIIQTENQYSKGYKPSKITLPLAKGKYIAFCEGDDYWTDPKKIQIQASFLENNKHISVCGHNSITMKDNKFIKAHPKSQRRDFNSRSLEQGAFVQILTAMFVNKFPIAPDEQEFIINGDDFLFSRLGKLGGYKYFEDISPGVYRNHGGGIWSSLDDRKKRANRINSFYWISQYYLRTGDPELASYFESKSAIAALTGTDKFSLKSFLRINNYFLRLLVKEKLPFTKTIKDRVYYK